MVDFTEVVQWDNPEDLQNNILYGLGAPVLGNALVVQEGLTIPSTSDNKSGKATYRYDFGRNGTVTGLRFDGTIFTKFRLKTSDTAAGLSLIDFDGTDRDKFVGTIFDTVKYSTTSNAYTITQNNSLGITGTQTAAGIFEDPAEITFNTLLSDTYTVRTSMRLLTNRDEPHDSGSLAFLRLEGAFNTIEVQKYEAQIRTQIVDAYGNSLGRDVNSNDIVLGEPIDVAVNDAVVDSASELTDGVLGTIKDVVTDPIVVDEILDLKVIEEITDYEGRVSLSSDCVRVQSLRADYSLTGILADLQRGLFYRPKRAHGYFAMRVPFVNARADLFSNDIKSLNFVDGEYVFAEVNDVWTVTTLVPPGVHFYRFSVDGEFQLDSANPNTVTIASGDYNIFTAENTQFHEFTFKGKAESVALVASFDSFSEKPMSVGFDPAQVLKINFADDAYYNDHLDWHKLEIEFEKPIPIVGIRFLSDVPFEHRQRVRILLDEDPLTRDEWEISCIPEDLSDAGVSECATYSNFLIGNVEEECLSAFINNTDVITASEDGIVEWSFVSDPVNDRDPQLYKKLTLMTRLENGSVFMRSHRELEVLLPTDTVARTADYLISDREVEFRAIRESQVGPSGDWCIPQVVLQSGVNPIIPVQTLDETVTYGSPVTILQTGLKSFVETLNDSSVALNNIEVACTLAGSLTQELEDVVEVVDLGGAAGTITDPDQRFTRESFTRANDSLRVVVINISIEPVKIYYLHLIGQSTNFLLELYETEEDALDRVNRVGFTESSGYGFQTIGTFTAERQIETSSGLEDIVVEDIIVCFDEDAADTVFINRPRINV